MFRIVMLAAMSLCSVTAQAASWNLFNSYAAEASETIDVIYFFDSDTIVKKNDTVTLWETLVFKEKTPASDGGYSAVRRVVYNCKKRTVQLLTAVTYDKSHQYIDTYPPGRAEDVTPESMGETLLKEVCAGNFPKNYYRIDNNDVYTAANYVLTYMKNAKKNPAPSKTTHPGF